LDSIGQRLFELNEGKVSLASRQVIRQLLETASKKILGHKFRLNFLLTEWEQVVHTWQLDSWESYRDVKRLGRKTRLPEPQRQLLWSIFDQIHVDLKRRNIITLAEMFSHLANFYLENKQSPFDFVVVDEAQDIDVAQLRFLAALSANKINGLFFAGDLGQRIFQQAFSWKSLGVDIWGRSRTLHINYRTSHQIRMQADHLLGPSLSDVDGNVEDRKGTVSVFNGPPPSILRLDTLEDEIESVSKWLVHLSEIGIKQHEIGVFVRSEDELGRAITAVSAASFAENLGSGA
jgi:superfamily I DNA/RNA helicase